MSFPTYEKYKESGIEWLGEVPDHWNLRPFWTLYRRMKRTGFPDHELLSVYRDYGVIQKADRDDNFNNPSEDLSTYQLVEPNNLVINKMKAWQGSVGVSQYTGIVSPAYFVYEHLHKEDSKFLHYLLRSLRYITANLTLSKGIRINQWDLDPIYHSRMPITLPPLTEQKKIVCFLDQETAKIDALIEEQRRLIGLLKEKRQAVISHAVTKGVDSEVPMRDSGIEWIGQIPRHWEIGAIKRWFETSSGGTPDTGRYSEFYSEGGTPWIRTTDLANSEVSSWEVAITDEAIASTACTVLPVGSILIAMYGGGGTIGKNGLLRISACINQALCALLPHSEFADLFTFRYVQFYRPYWMIGAVSARIDPNISQDLIRNAPILKPPLEEQHKIAAFLDEKIAMFDELEMQTASSISMLEERRSALISAVVTGKIDVRNYVGHASVAPEEVHEFA